MAAPAVVALMPPLRVGVIGVGGIAQMMHLPTLAERPDLFTIAALADISEKTLNAVGDRYGVATRVRDYRELLGRPDLDALLVFTSGCHRDAMLDLVKSDKHLFVEKPLAYSLKETEEVAAAARGRRGAAHGRVSQALRPRVPARARRGAEHARAALRRGHRPPSRRLRRADAPRGAARPREAVVAASGVGARRRPRRARREGRGRGMRRPAWWGSRRRRPIAWARSSSSTASSTT